MEFAIERLKKEDYFNGFLELLQQLTVVQKEDVTYDDFCKQYDSLKSDVYVIRSKDNNQKNKIVATASIFIEPKFTHKLGSVAHIEEVVVDIGCRGSGLGKKLIDHLVCEAKKQGCYKIILNCSEENCGFYKKCHFVKKGVQMVQYF